MRELAGDLSRRAGSEPLALRCRGLRLALGGRPILEGIDLDVAPGAAVGIMGPSGSGKTTLLHCLAGLHKPDDGEVTVDSVATTKMTKRQRARFRLERVGMVFQFGELLEELTVEENVALPLRLRNRQDPERVASLLSRVGLAERAASWPAELSGGEVQRVAIARALVGSPVLLLADEPTGALDEDLSEAVCGLLVSMARASGAVLVVATHDPLVASAMDSVGRLRRGKLETA